MRLKEASQTLDRARALVRDGISGQADLDRAEAEVDALKARLELTREQVTVAERQVALRQADLDDTVIRAPFSGVAISKDAQPGEMMSPVSAGGGFTRTGISTIVDMSSLEIEVDVNESFINRVTPGQTRRGDARRVSGLAHSRRTSSRWCPRRTARRRRCWSASGSSSSIRGSCRTWA